jgi:hypothetical protein
MSAGVRLIGGPGDGRLTIVPGETPAPTLEVSVPPVLAYGAEGLLNVPVVLRKALYRLVVSPFDDGPLWLYLYDEEASR